MKILKNYPKRLALPGPGGLQMKKSTITLLITILVITFGVLGAADQKFGKDFAVKESVKISKVLEKPEENLNKPIKVEGTIVGVCAHKGCWMELASDKEFQKLRVKVKDGDMVFPMTAKGKTAVVEGILYKIDLTKEQAQKLHEHQCKEKDQKKEAKKADCCASTKLKTVIYQLKPTSVVIKG
jgi:uncharacterized protein DUF4920